MKLKLKKNKSGRASSLKSAEPKLSKPAKPKGKKGWMIVGEQAQRQAVQQQRSMMMKGRPPEMWLRDGDEKLVRFRDPGPVVSFFCYSLKINGRFMRITQPEEGERDLFLEGGERFSFYAVYEVIDIDGYTSKQDGKVHKNVPRFYVAGSRVYENLSKIAQRKGDLCNYDILISRSGSRAQTTYNFLPENDSQMPKALAKLPRLSDKLEEYYAPPDEAEQRMLLGQRQPDNDDDE